MQYGDPGPYEHGGNQYAFLESVPSHSGGTFVQPYKSTDGGVTWTALTTGQQAKFGFMSVFYPGSGTLVYISYVSTAAGTHIFTQTFDLSTETLSSSFDTGINGVNANSIFFLKMPSGLWVVLYDKPSPNGGIFAVTSADSGVTWSGAITLFAAGTLTLLENPVIDGSGNIGINYSFWTNTTIGDRASERYCIFNGATVTADVVALADASHINRGPSILQYPIIYNALRDSIIIPVGEGTGLPTNSISVLVGSPSAAPVFTKILIWTDATPPTDQPWFPAITQSTDGTLISVLWANDLGNFPFDSILQLSQSSDTPLATWTAPSTVYDETANPPTPAPNFGELLPANIRTLSDGTLAILVGTNQKVASSDNWCGLMNFFALLGGLPLSAACPINGGTAQVGVPYDKQLIASGGTPPYTWRQIS